MSYGKDLLTAAVAKAGSRYALHKLTGLAQSELSRAWNGQRDVPAAWILPLARIAELDPTEAMENWDLERAEKKRQRQQSLRSAAAGETATSPTSATKDAVSDAASGASIHQRTKEQLLTLLHIVSKRTRSAIRSFRRQIEPLAPSVEYA